MDKFYENERDLLLYFLDTYKYPNINKEKPTEWSKGAFTEIIANPSCNQQCEYCYIHRYGKELFPMNERQPKEIQVKHFSMLLDYFIKHKIFVPRWEIYGGDLFHDGIFWDLLDVFVEKYDYIYSIEPSVFKEFGATKEGQIEIIVPNNMSYFESLEQKEKLFKKYENLRDHHRIVLGFSWSTDGKYAVDSREKKSLPDKYWENMLAFCKSLRAGLHPMISPENVKNWCENYDWWLEVHEKFGFHDQPVHFQPPMLEVRNAEWTSENLTDYMKLLKHIFDIRLNKFCDGDIKKMAHHYFVGDGSNDNLPRLFQMDPLWIPVGIRKEMAESLCCSMQEQVHINLSDLAIVPCHRLAYEQFRGGYFEYNDTEITGLIPKNVSFYITSKTFTTPMLPKCFNCEWKHCCMNACLGANFEYWGEPFLTPEPVCNLLKVKYNFLIKLLNETGVLQCALDNNYIRDQFVKNWFIKISRVKGYNVHG